MEKEVKTKEMTSRDQITEKSIPEPKHRKRDIVDRILAAYNLNTTYLWTPSNRTIPDM